MDIRLAYGKQGLFIHLPDQLDITVIEPTFVPGLTDPESGLKQALQRPVGTAPLRESVLPGDRVGVVFSDITRPTPHQLILPAVLAELSHLPSRQITLFNALGTHRPDSQAELREMLGDELVERYRIVQNNAFDPSTQVCIGRSSFGHEIWLNREFYECDVKILTGFIEPHFFAGFSGDGKAVMPGMAGQRTVLGNHDAEMIGNPNSTWGITHGNPIWEEVREVAHQVGKTFLVNVTLNKNKEITGIFTGELDAAHAAGCAFVKATAMVPVLDSFDLVITTNSGYPLDLNLYQSVKGMSAAAQIVKPGGTIIVAAECWDGIPEHGLYGQLLREAKDPQDLLNTICKPGFLKQDQWEAQIQAQIQLKADVSVFSDYLTDEQILSAMLKPCRSIEAMVEEQLCKTGPKTRICILPEGPQTIPYLQSE
jgi:nickel-dependent lactate racemase